MASTRSDMWPIRATVLTGRGVAREPVGVFAEAAEHPPAFVAEQVERRDRAACHAGRAEADAAVADDHGGHALAHLAQHAGGAAEHGAVVVGVGVDEAGSQRAAGGEHLAVCGGAAEVADVHDAVSGHADIGAVAGGAGAVEHGSVADDEVAVHGGAPCSTAFTGRNCG